tara:strand:+ start:98 stop:283 length:186 start_codon:yes stop_codon:yes gene_type:complete
MKKIIIQDDFGNDYKVNDLKKFIKHFEDFHLKNVQGDGSLHMENGRHFTILPSFFKLIKSL